MLSLRFNICIARPVYGHAQVRLAVLDRVVSCSGQALLLEGVQHSWGRILLFQPWAAAQIPAPTLGNSYSPLISPANLTQYVLKVVFHFAFALNLAHCRLKLSCSLL